MSKLGRMFLFFLMFAFAAEVIFRGVLFSPWFRSAPIKDPGKYFNYFSDTDYWSLNYLFGYTIAGVPKNFHPLLGWKSNSYDADFRHQEASFVQGRKPVLMYGDSFGTCVRQKECFQNYFNNDPDLSKRCYFLNYSTSAHGIDQTYLLYKNSVANYKKPLVMYSLMTLDLDRATVSAFTGAKPYFEIEKNNLVLKGVPAADSERFFRERDLGIYSYLGRYLWREFKKIDGNSSIPENRQRVKRFSEHILTEVIADVKKRNHDFFFLIFVPDWHGESAIWQDDKDDWRLQIVLEILQKHRLKYAVTKQFVQAESIRTKAYDFFIPGNDHPNEMQNRLIFRELKENFFLKHCGSESASAAPL